LSSRGRGGGHGRGFRCVTCGGMFPVTRRNLKASKASTGFRCVRCEQGGGKRPQRPSNY